MSIWLVLGLAPLTLLKCELLITVQFGSLVVRVLLVTVCAVGLYCHIAMAELLRQTKSGSALVLKSPLALTTGAPTLLGMRVAEVFFTSANRKSCTLLMLSIPSGEPDRKSMTWNDPSAFCVT